VSQATGRLAGRVALITGGGSGIGRASALLFAREGARLVVAGWVAAEVEDVVAEIRSGGGEAVGAVGDVGLAADAERMVRTALERFGRLDVLVNSAGQELVASVPETSEAQWDRVLSTNLKGTFLVCRAAIPAMIAGGGGTIVNVASQLALVGARNFAAYTASKGAVLNLTRSMALDHARDNIRVNALCPGAVDTPLLRRQFEGRAGPQGTLADLAALHALGRLAHPDELAAAALFLASDESSFMTGAPLIVDGGYTAG
jgi:NAD(P)-dependent dehydrogenase (short-subunit alcohol dehydrogenase family)